MWMCVECSFNNVERLWHEGFQSGVFGRSLSAKNQPFRTPALETLDHTTQHKTPCSRNKRPDAPRVRMCMVSLL